MKIKTKQRYSNRETILTNHSVQEVNVNWPQKNRVFSTFKYPLTKGTKNVQLTQHKTNLKKKRLIQTFFARQHPNKQNDPSKQSFKQQKAYSTFQVRKRSLKSNSLQKQYNFEFKQKKKPCQKINRFKKKNVYPVHLNKIFIMRDICLEKCQKDNLRASQVDNLKNIFENVYDDQICLTRHWSENCKGLLTQLLFFAGYQIYLRNRDAMSEDLLITIQFQIYLCLRLSLPLMALECLLNGSKLCLKANQIEISKRYAQNGLIMSIFHKNQEYQDIFVDQLSLIEYYLGNVYEALYLHENIGKITPQSAKKIKQNYQESDQLISLEKFLFSNRQSIHKQTIFNSIFENSGMYKNFIIFQNHRIESTSYYQLKNKQASYIINQMKRQPQWNQSAQIIKKAMNRTQTSYKVIKKNKQVRKILSNKPNEKEDSAQIIKTHLSLNRNKKVSKLKRKHLKEEKQQFLKFLSSLLVKIQKKCSKML